MTADGAPGRRLLLDLIADAHDIDPARLDLDPATWIDLARIAEQHRLEPLLHWQIERRHPGLPVPTAIADRWKNSFVASSRRQLGAQYEMRALRQTLDAAGMPSVLLKGAFLAFHAYPDPALRPLRDIDVLVPDDRVVDAYHLLLRSGATPCAGEAKLEFALEMGQHHLPALSTPRGFAIVELHRHIQNLAAAAPEDRDAQLLDEIWRYQVSLPLAGVAVDYPSPTDMLLHLVLHATQNHALNNGPLTLPDIAFLLRAHAIDWNRFWSGAERVDATRAATLLLDLTERYWGPLPIDRAAGARDAELAQIGDLAVQVMLQDWDVASDIWRERRTEKGSRARMSAALRSLFLPPREMAIIHHLPPGSARVWLFYPLRWGSLVGRGLSRLTRNRRKDEVRDQVDAHARIAHWMAPRA